MAWDEEKLMGELDDYFDNATKEQFLKDVEKSDSLHLIEDVDA